MIKTPGASLLSMLNSSYFSKEAHITIILIYVVITLLNFLANSLIWVAVRRNRNLRSPMNYLLLNLSLADMISAISIYPWLFILDVGVIFHAPGKQAHLCIATEGLSLFFLASGASLFTLCGISFNRFLAIRYPTRQTFRINRSSALGFSILTWIMSIACMLPGMISFKYEQKFKTCVRDWGSINGLVCRILILILGTVLPSTFLFITYTAILVKSRAAVVIAAGRISGRRHMRKAEKMLGALIAVYILCWFPFCTYWTLLGTTNFFPRTINGVRLSNRWFRVTVLFCTLNGTLNPIVYVVGSSESKKAIKNSMVNFWFRIVCRRKIGIESLSLRRISRVSVSQAYQSSMSKFSD